MLETKRSHTDVFTRIQESSPGEAFGCNGSSSEWSESEIFELHMHVVVRVWKELLKLNGETARTNERTKKQGGKHQEKKEANETSTERRISQVSAVANSGEVHQV